MTDLDSQRVTLTFIRASRQGTPMRRGAWLLTAVASAFLLARDDWAQDYALACDLGGRYWLRHKDKLWSVNREGEVICGPIRADADWRIHALDGEVFCWGGKGATNVDSDGQTSPVEELSIARISACAGNSALLAAVGTLDHSGVVPGTHGEGNSGGFIAISKDKSKTWVLYPWKQGLPIAIAMAGDSSYAVLTNAGCVFDVRVVNEGLDPVLRQADIPHVDYGAWLSVNGDAVLCGGMSYDGASRFCVVENGRIVARDIDPGVGLGQGEGFVFVAADRLVLLKDIDLLKDADFVEVFVLPAIEAACVDSRGNIYALDTRQRIGVFNTGAASMTEWVVLNLAR